MSSSVLTTFLKLFLWYQFPIKLILPLEGGLTSRRNFSVNQRAIFSQTDSKDFNVEVCVHIVHHTLNSTVEKLCWLCYYIQITWPSPYKRHSKPKSNGHSFRASWQSLQAEPWHYSDLATLLQILKWGHSLLPLETLHIFSCTVSSCPVSQEAFINNLCIIQNLFLV